MDTLFHYAHKPVFARSQNEIGWRAQEYTRLRSELKLSRAVLSEITGLKISTLNQIPYKNKTVSLLVLERMRAALEVKKTHINDANDRAIETMHKC